MRMKRPVIPKFSSEAQEAAWWDSHRSEIEADIRQRMEREQNGAPGDFDWERGRKG